MVGEVSFYFGEGSTRRVVLFGDNLLRQGTTSSIEAPDECDNVDKEREYG